MLGLVNAVGKKVQNLPKKLPYKALFREDWLGKVLFCYLSVQRNQNGKFESLLYLREREL